MYSRIISSLPLRRLVCFYFKNFRSTIGAVRRFGNAYKNEFLLLGTRCQTKSRSYTAPAKGVLLL